MNRLRMGLIALAMLALQVFAPPGTARSEVGGLHLNITPYGGYGVWAKEVNLNNRGMYGGRLGLGFGRYIGIEGSYGWMKTRTEYGTGDSLFTASSFTPSTQQSVHLYGVDLMFNLVPKSGLDPYVFGGWHEEKFKTSDASQHSFMNGPEIGGGFKVRMSKKVALRFEIRDKMW